MSPIDLLPLPSYDHLVEPIETFMHHIHNVYIKIHTKFPLINIECQLDVDVHKRIQNLNIGDYVIVCTHLDGTLEAHLGNYM